MTEKFPAPDTGQPQGQSIATESEPGSAAAPTIQHRWSGWPGAWCLDCGAGDPMEAALANDDVVFTEESFEYKPGVADKYKLGPCPEPGSRRHDPYASR